MLKKFKKERKSVFVLLDQASLLVWMFGSITLTHSIINVTLYYIFERISGPWVLFFHQ